jgi:hypothetical protein
MKYILVCLIAMTLVGCTVQPSSFSVTEGVVEGLIILPEECCYTGIFVEFNDGRVVRFRCYNGYNFSIQKGVKNRIYHNGVNFDRSEVVDYTINHFK